MSLRAAGVRSTLSERYDARLARRILAGGSSAPKDAIALLEYCDPETLDVAVGLVAEEGALTQDVIDCVTEAWETYRHLKHLCWD